MNDHFVYKYCVVSHVFCLTSVLFSASHTVTVLSPCFAQPSRLSLALLAVGNQQMHASHLPCPSACYGRASVTCTMFCSFELICRGEHGDSHCHLHLPKHAFCPVTEPLQQLLIADGAWLCQVRQNMVRQALLITTLRPPANDTCIEQASWHMPQMLLLFLAMKVLHCQL